MRPKYRGIAEKLIGRKIASDEVVHHIDGNHYNDSPENLQVMKRSDHQKLHNLKNIEALREAGKLNLGRKHSRKSRLNMSIAHTGVKLTAEHARAIGDGHKGIVLGPSSKKHRKNISIALTGRKLSEEHRKGISERVKAWWKSRKDGAQ